MKPKLVDVHTHLQFLDFDKDRDETIERAFNEGVYFINVGANKKSSQRAVELADKYSTEIWATVGQHPSDLKDFDYGFLKIWRKIRKWWQLENADWTTIN